MSQKDTILLVMSPASWSVLHHPLPSFISYHQDGRLPDPGRHLHQTGEIAPHPESAGVVPYYGREGIPLQPGKKYPASGWSQLSALF